MSIIWKPILNYEGLYEISSDGRVYSVRNDKELKLCINEKGYARVCLQKDGNKSWKRVHRLVAEAFIPNPLNKPTVNHINRIRNDNRVDNLEWDDITEQVNDPERLRLISELMKINAYVESKKRPVVKKSTLGEVITVFESIHEAARSADTSPGNIWKCCNNSMKTCRGFIYSYA